MKAIKKNVWLIVIAFLFACNQAEKDRILPVNDFFKSQDKATYKISPDGKSISFLKLLDKKQNLFVEDIASGKVVQLTKLQETNISFYAWVSDNELIYYKEIEGGRFKPDLFIINKAGTDERQLNSKVKARIKILEEQLINDKFLLVSSNQRDSTVSDVYRLNVRDGSMQIAAQNPGNVTRWVTDNKGKLKMAIASDGVNETFLYRKNEWESFKPIVTNNFKTTLLPIAFSESDPNTLYAISNVNRDKNALIELDCITGKEKKVLFANDTLNVVEAQYSRRKSEMEYVVAETWKKEKHYLDNDAQAFYHKLDQLLPATEYRIINKDKNENVFIVRTFTDRNPGSYYLYIASSGKLRKLSDINSAINEKEMSRMEPISYLSRDGLKISGYLTLPLYKEAKNLPVVVLPHNGPGQRNVWGYNAEVQFLANRGYAVLQINYRGSTGYGKNFYAAGFKQWGGKIQDDIDDGVLWLIKKRIANPKRIAIYGSGFGGQIALNAAIKSPRIYQCAASNSGVLNLFSYLNSIPPFLKSNVQMYYELVGNPVTEVDYMRKASPLFQAEKINIPVFITQNINDPRINASDGFRLVKELKKRDVPVTYVERKEAHFTINREESRQKFYTSLERFLGSNLKNK